MNTSTILIIEDEAPLRELISEMLQCQNFNTIEAEDGQKGVEKALKELPSLIVCDIMMPKLDGYGVLTELQRYPQTSQIPLIFLTAKVSRENLRLGMNLGADDYLTKPFSQEELVEAVKARLTKQSSVQSYYHLQVQQVNRKAHYYLYHNPVTQFPNQFVLRQLFDQRIEQLYGDDIGTIKTEKLLPIAYLRLDQFSEISEMIGYEASDQLLKAIAQKLRSVLGQKALITQFSSDEFVILLEAVKYQQQADSQAQKILDQWTQPFNIDNQEIFISSRIGMAFYPSHGRTLEQVVNNSKRAIERVKNLGGNQYQRYLPAFYLTQRDQQRRLELETKLHHAIEQNELELYYQPRVDLITGEITGAEALVRWHSSQKELVSPAEFIPIAEATGLIQPIGSWVLKNVCKNIKELHEIEPNLKLSVNLSARQFYALTSHKELLQILHDLSIKTHCLELEITESVLVDNIAVARTKLNAFKTLGVKIAVDDFGTGYSSLQYLQELPIDILKIDRSFVHQVDQDPKNAIITKTLISLARQLNLHVIAEGVETEGEMQFLQKNHCQEAQGYLFSRPIPFKAFKEKIQLSSLGKNYALSELTKVAESAMAS